MTCERHRVCAPGYQSGFRLQKTGPAGRLKLTSSAIVPARAIRPPNFAFRAAIVLGAGLAIASTSVFAEIQVRGSPEAVTVEARDTSVEEILAALSRAFDMDYQSSVNLDKPLYGTYVGSLSRVLTRILQGYNFILKTENGSIAVTVVGRPYAPAANPPAASPASGDPRAPAPEPQQSGAPAPVPRSSGSTPAPAPEPASSARMSAPVITPKL
jgi:hypothetical protein